MKKILILLLMTVLLAGCDSMMPVEPTAPNEQPGANDAAPAELADNAPEAQPTEEEMSPAATSTPVI